MYRGAFPDMIYSSSSACISARSGAVTHIASPVSGSVKRISPQWSACAVMRVQSPPFLFVLEIEFTLLGYIANGECDVV